MNKIIKKNGRKTVEYLDKEEDKCSTCSYYVLCDKPTEEECFRNNDIHYKKKREWDIKRKSREED